MRAKRSLSHAHSRFSAFFACFHIHVHYNRRSVDTITSFVIHHSLSKKGRHSCYPGAALKFFGGDWPDSVSSFVSRQKPGPPPQLSRFQNSKRFRFRNLNTRHSLSQIVELKSRSFPFLPKLLFDSVGFGLILFRHSCQNKSQVPHPSFRVFRESEWCFRL